MLLNVTSKNIFLDKAIGIVYSVFHLYTLRLRSELMDLAELHLHWRASQYKGKSYRSYSLARGYRENGDWGRGRKVRKSISQIVAVLMRNGLCPFHCKSHSKRTHFKPLGQLFNRHPQLTDSPKTASLASLLAVACPGIIFLGAVSHKF